MSRLQNLLEERNKVLKQMEGIVAMRRGSVARQMLPVIKDGEATDVRRGPYHLHTYKKNGRTVSRRLRDKNDIRRLSRQVHNYHQFHDLCRRLVEIGEAICEIHEGR